MKEVQSLSLDMQVQSEEGGILEVHEEDDDLLRAAEELGIDLGASLRQRGGVDDGAALGVPGLSGFLGARPPEADGDGDGDGDGDVDTNEITPVAVVGEDDEDIDLAVDGDDEEEFPDTDIVKALGVELEDHDDAEPDEIDHSDE
jgi:DNA-directed RNA polymerase subunit beta